MTRRTRPAMLGVYLLVSVALFSPAWLDPTGRLIGAGGDALQFAWFLRWTPFALAHGLNPFFSDYVNYPDGINLMWNTNVFLPALVLSPVTSTLGPVVAGKVLVTSALALSAWCGMLALRRTGFSPVGAALGGLFYGFSPYMLSQSLGHANLVLAVAPPLFLILFMDLFEGRHSPLLTGLLLGFLAAAQLLTSEELLASSAVCSVVLAGTVALVKRDAFHLRWRDVAVAGAAGGTVFVVLGAVPLVAQFAGRATVSGAIQSRNVYVADLLNFVIPTRVHAAAPTWALSLAARFTGNDSERNAYLGAPLLALAVYTAIRAWQLPRVRVAAVAGLAMAVLSLGSRLHVGGVDTRVPLPFAAISSLPLLGDLLPARLALYGAFSAAALLAAFVDLPWRRSANRPPVLAGVTMVALVLVSIAPAIPYPSIPVPQPPFFTGAPTLPDGAVALVVPYSSTQETTAAMLWQADSNMSFRMPEGYFIAPDESGRGRLGPRPSRLSTAVLAVESGTRPQPDPTDPAIAADLARLRVRYVLVADASIRREALVRFFTSVLDRPGTTAGGVTYWTVGLSPGSGTVLPAQRRLDTSPT